MLKPLHPIDFNITLKHGLTWGEGISTQNLKAMDGGISSSYNTSFYFSKSSNVGAISTISLNRNSNLLFRSIDFHLGTIVCLKFVEHPVWFSGDLSVAFLLRETSFGVFSRLVHYYLADGCIEVACVLLLSLQDNSALLEVPVMIGMEIDAFIFFTLRISDYFFWSLYNCWNASSTLMKQQRRLSWIILFDFISKANIFLHSQLSVIWR